MTQKAPRRVALLGAGYIAEWHAKALRTLPGIELAAVCDRALSRAESLAASFRIHGVYGSLEGMLASERLDAVHVLLPPEAHSTAARTIIEAGLDVFLEMPMCATADRCRELIRIAAARSARIGVGHNFLFARPYEQLRRAVRECRLGRLRSIRADWHRPLPQALFGPFDTWMLRDPRNIAVEIGPHPWSAVLDLAGTPENLRVHASDPVTLPTGRRFYRRWLATAEADGASVEVSFQFGPSYGRFSLEVFGTQAAATVDFGRNTFLLHAHRPADQDFDIYGQLRAEARSLAAQARATFADSILTEAKLRRRGNPYGASIARAMEAFYAPSEPDRRISASLGARSVEICERMGDLAYFPPEETAPAPHIVYATPSRPAPELLVLGATGFIGREVVRQLAATGRRARLLARSAAVLPAELRTGPIEVVRGDLSSREDLLGALDGVRTVLHLARANVRTWADYQRLEIEATRRVAECALEAGVQRFVYTGAIDSYYAGRHAGTITEETPLDPRIASRNLYARAKAESEALLGDLHRERGLPLVVARPGIVIGRGGSPFHWGVGRWWEDAICQIWGSGRNPLPFVLVEDVARGLLAACDRPGLEGRSFNLVAEPCLTAHEYLDALDRAAGIRIDRRSTPIFSFYWRDLLEYCVKVAVRHPERRLPSYRDWESRTQRARFDCRATQEALDWRPASDPETMIRQGIEVPVREFLA